MADSRKITVAWPAELLTRAEQAARSEGLTFSAWLRRVATLALRGRE